MTKTETKLPFVAGERVLLRPDKADEKTAGGILLPDAARNDPDTGIVLATGDSDGKYMGQRVYFLPYAKVVIDVDGEKLAIVKIEDIVAFEA